MTVSIKTKRTINLIRKISEIVTGIGTTVLGYNDEWKFACGVMVAGYVLNKIASLIESDAKIISHESTKL